MLFLLDARWGVAAIELNGLLQLGLVVRTDVSSTESPPFQCRLVHCDLRLLSERGADAGSVDIQAARDRTPWFLSWRSARLAKMGVSESSLSEPQGASARADPRTAIGILFGPARLINVSNDVAHA